LKDLVAVQISQSREQFTQECRSPSLGQSIWSQLCGWNIDPNPQPPNSGYSCPDGPWLIQLAAAFDNKLLAGPVNQCSIYV
jgi:hypothetical protein